MKYRSTDPKLEVISNALLDAAYEPTAADIEFEVMMSNDDAFADATAKDVQRRMKRGRIINAIDTNNRPLAVKIAGDDPELLRLAASFSRGKGQQRDRSGDHSDIYRQYLYDLWHEAALLRRLWKDNDILVSGKGVHRSPKDAAFRIVVRRTLTPDPFDRATLLRQLKTFDGNRNRKPKDKGQG